MPTPKRRRQNGNTAEVVYSVALEQFYARGYHATSIRDIASAAGASISSVFHHHTSKAALLDRIIRTGYEQLLEEMVAATDGIDDPVERLAVTVRVHVRRHCVSLMESSVALREFRSLEPKAQKQISVMAEKIHDMFAQPIEEGVAAGLFTCDRPRQVAHAIHSMCSSVGSWYRPAGELTAEGVAELYSELALRMAGATAAAGVDE